jgi:hypothetical protein
MDWRGLVNAILYTVQFDRDLDDETIDRVAHTLIEQPLLGLTPPQEYDALVEALRSGEPMTDDISQPHAETAVGGFLAGVANRMDAETAVGGFLAGVANRMDALRPWPELSFVQLNVSEWDRFGGARPIARVHVWYVQAQGRLRKGFDQLDTGRDVLLLRLSSGAEVALVTPWWEGSDDLALLLNTPDRSPRDVLTEFGKATGFGADEITPLD